MHRDALVLCLFLASPMNLLQERVCDAVSSCYLLSRKERSQIVGSKACTPSDTASKAIITSLIRPDLFRAAFSSVKLIRGLMHCNIAKLQFRWQYRAFMIR